MRDYTSVTIVGSTEKGARMAGGTRIQSATGEVVGGHSRGDHHEDAERK
jgi:hypothetical protein